MTTQDATGYYVDTVGGAVFIPDGVPSWVADSLVEQAGGRVDVPPPPPPVQETNTPGAIGGDSSTAPGPTTSPGNWIPGPNGPVWIPAGVPDWVIASILEQAGRAPAAQTGPSTVPLTPPPPPMPGPGPTTMPKPVPVPAPTAQNPNPVGAPPANRIPGTLGYPTIVQDVKDTAAAILARARETIAPAADFIGATINGILDSTRAVVDYLAPTVSELALGLTSRFGDLASFIGSNLASVGDLADSLSGGIASGFSIVLDDAWTWLLRSLLGMLRILGKPASWVRDRLTQGVVQAEL